MQSNLLGACLKGVAAAVAVGLSVGAQAEDTWFVSQTGSNDNTGKSTDDAFLTVGKAVSSAVEGDTIIVAASEEEYPLDEEIKLITVTTDDDRKNTEKNYKKFKNKLHLFFILFFILCE